MTAHENIPTATDWASLLVTVDVNQIRGDKPPGHDYPPQHWEHRKLCDEFQPMCDEEWRSVMRHQNWSDSTSRNRY